MTNLTPEEQAEYERARAQTTEYQWAMLGYVVCVLILEIARELGVIRVLDWISAVLARKGARR